MAKGTASAKALSRDMPGHQSDSECIGKAESWGCIRLREVTTVVRAIAVPSSLSATGHSKLFYIKLKLNIKIK